MSEYKLPDDAVIALRGQLRRRGLTRTAGEVRAAAAPFLREFPIMHTNLGALAGILTRHFEIVDQQKLDAAREDRGPRSVSLDPPADWKVHSRKVFAQFRDIQVQAIAVLGLGEPLEAVWQIGPLLQARAEGERSLLGPKGRVELLNYPRYGLNAAGEVERAEDAVQIWSGFTEDEVEAFLQKHRDDRGLVMGVRITGLDISSRPLWRLRDLALVIVEKTGVSESEALAYLLADDDVMLPWIKTVVHERFATGTIAVTLEIGSTAVRPDEVRRAYADLRANPFEHYGPDFQDLLQAFAKSPRAYTRRSINERSAAMFDFVERRWAASGTSRMTAAEWDDLNESFGVAGYQKYKNGATMRATYENAHPGGKKGSDHGHE